MRNLRQLSTCCMRSFDVCQEMCEQLGASSAPEKASLPHEVELLAPGQLGKVTVRLCISPL